MSDSTQRIETGAHSPTPGPLSPSLRASSEKAAFELKFAVPLMQARDILERARCQMTLDPYCDPQLGEAYEVHGLYFDTPALHVYRRVGSHAMHKLRLRRYGRSESVFLEHKTKANGRVSKRRTFVRDAELDHLVAEKFPRDWEGAWFRQRMRMRRVRPVCEVSYLRTALTGDPQGEPFRLTLDRHLRCRRFVDWQVRGANEDASPLTDKMILELKFCDAMPAFFKQLIADFQLSVGRLSKYRLGVEACGLAPATAPQDVEGAEQRPDEPLSRTA